MGLYQKAPCEPLSNKKACIFTNFSTSHDPGKSLHGSNFQRFRNFHSSEQSVQAARREDFLWARWKTGNVLVAAQSLIEFLAFSGKFRVKFLAFFRSSPRMSPKTFRKMPRNKKIKDLLHAYLDLYVSEGADQTWGELKYIWWLEFLKKC